MRTAATGGKVTTCGNCDKPESYRCEGIDGKQLPCPVFGIPESAWAVMNLYNRCQARQALPYQGGVLDQPERLMRFFDIIDAEIGKHQDRKRTSTGQRPQLDTKPTGKR